MKFLDLFAGIGGFRLGLEQAGHECVGFCEIDKFARQSYKAIHNTEGEREYHDITAVSNEEWRTLRGTVDIICGGFPCQSFSIAGKRKGFLDETRGTLFFEIARAAEQIKPRTLFLENVRGLLSHDKGRTFRTIISTLNELGYDAEWQILNSKNFGVPQNRERVFIIGHLRGGSGREVFPVRGKDEYLDSKINNAGVIPYGTGGIPQQRAVVKSNGISPALLATGYKDPQKIMVINKENGMPCETNRVYSSEGLSPTLNTMQGGGGEPKIAIKIKEATKQGYAIAEQGDSINFSLPNSKTRRGRVGKQAAQTLDTSCNQATITNDMRVRKLTPRECWRLQGFPDWAFDKAQEVNSNSQLYKQAGNSVTVPVIYEIARRLE
ncbi:DNA (cytosine-5-)-methyltransferase [Lactococcus taiwanensis]|uniref:DNA (cytosine-5-)-methyltransferase n=1 Tax=Lactococcus taiwanensis TaxID=1151742 RepID=UPI001962A685|nr:DNA (cytosine-5-)-methyltransferase [Lactococcus taiwanensis]QRZ11743.1 DNA (cytosine-5-)-methyltransferase [Lactococcus taiwanensis]